MGVYFLSCHLSVTIHSRSRKLTQIGQSLLVFRSCFSVGHLPEGMNLTNSTGVTSGRTDRSSLKQNNKERPKPGSRFGEYDDVLVITYIVLRHSGLGMTTPNDVNELWRSVRKAGCFVKKIDTLATKNICTQKGIFGYVFVNSYQPL